MSDDKHAAALAAAGIAFVPELPTVYKIMSGKEHVGFLLRPAATDFWTVEIGSERIDSQHLDREDAERVAYHRLTGREIGQ